MFYILYVVVCVFYLRESVKRVHDAAHIARLWARIFTLRFPQEKRKIAELVFIFQLFLSQVYEKPGNQ